MALGERSHLASVDMILHLRTSAHKFADCRTDPRRSWAKERGTYGLGSYSIYRVRSCITG
jgi:hypothetical protein